MWGAAEQNETSWAGNNETLWQGDGWNDTRLDWPPNVTDTVRQLAADWAGENGSSTFSPTDDVTSEFPRLTEPAQRPSGNSSLHESLRTVANFAPSSGFAPNASEECDPMTDHACLMHVSPLSATEIVQIVTLSILFLLSLTGNSVALIKMTRNAAQLRHSIYQLMLQLILADLFVTFFCLFGDALHKITVNWYADDATCKIYKLLGSFAQFLSSYIVALVAVNRALVVIKPMLSPSKMKRIMQYLITAVWVFSLLMSVPQLIIWSKVRGPFIEEFYDCTTIGHNWTDVESMLHACVISSFIFIVPLLIMAVSYILVVRTLARTTVDQKISIWYTACWLPYIIVFIAMAIQKNEIILKEMSRWCIFFGQTNCIVNPIIYASFHLRKSNVAKKSANRIVTVKMTLNQSTSHDCFRSSQSNEQICSALRDTGVTHNLELSGQGQEETQIEFVNQSS